MFSSLFSTAPPVDPHAPNFHPVSSAYPPSDIHGELEPKDISWACPSGFAVETQTFYNILEDGSLLMFQVIHSSIGVWYPTIQFTFKLFRPDTKERTWKSINVTNFVTPPPGLDKRSSKGDQFSITYKSKPGADTPELYLVTANLDDELQLTLEIARPAAAPGFKYGKGPAGGFSQFGPDPKNAEGYVVHRFWPRTLASGLLVHKGQAIAVKGAGMFVHAIQGMRPNLVAARWNFAFFTSAAHGGVSAILMDFSTTPAYGRKGAGSGGVTVSVGGLVVGGKLAAVTGETAWPGEAQAEGAELVSRAIHSKRAHDEETGYEAPTELVYKWGGPSVVAGAGGRIEAGITLDLGTPDNYNNLVEKIDVLAEIPYAIKAMVNYLAGTKPYLYQWINPTTLQLKVPEGVIPGASGEVAVEGTLYNEATFIS